MRKRFRSSPRKRKFKDYVFLGQGVHYWVAQEAGLKITEMSSSYAQVYHSLGISPRAPLDSRAGYIDHFLYVGCSRGSGNETLRRMKELRAATCVIVNRATPGIKETRDLLIELALDGPEFARYAVTAIPAQLLGTAIGLRKGLNPDAPKNLTRAVVLSTDAKRR